MKKKITITGMNCGHCVARVKGIFGENNKVNNVDVMLEGSYVLLDSTLSDEEIVKILGEDYPVVNIEELLS